MRKSCLAGLCAFLFLACLVPVTRAQLTSLTEGFDTVGSFQSATGIFAEGWVNVNNSDVPNTTAFNWEQGDSGTFIYTAQSPPGSTTSFIQDSFLSTNGTVLSDWLLTPVLTLEAGATISFYTTAVEGTTFANDLQVYISTSGSSTSVGTDAQTPTGGVFTLLPGGDLNHTLAANGYPNTPPDGWTLETFTLTSSEVSTPVSGRIGFRYYLPNTTTEGSEIGIDTFSFADPSVFTRTVSGNWTDTTGWTPATVPNGITVEAQLVNPGSGTNSVDLGGGTFTVNQLQFSGTNSGTWTVVNGIIIFDGTNPTFLNQGGSSGLVGTLPNLQLNADTTFEIDDSAAVTDVTGAISGVGGLIKTGSGTLELNGTNTYSGGTTISEGILSVSADDNLGTSTGALTFNGGTLETTAGFSSSRAITLNTGGGTFQADTGTLSLSGIISGLGGLTKTGAGTLVLSGVNTYSGGTTISGGILSVSADDNLGASTGALTFNGGTLETTAGFSSSRAITLDTNGGTFQADTGTLSLSGIVSGLGGLTKTGAGTLVLSGVNTYSGGTTISGGILSVSADDNLGTSTGALTFNGGTLETTAGFSSSRAITLNTNGGTFQADTGTLSLSGIISGLGGLTKTGTATLVLSGVNTYTGGTTISGGILSVSADDNLGASTGALTFNGGTLEATAGFSSSRAIALNTSGGTFQVDTGTLSLSSIISGLGGLTETGAGTLVLSGVNTYSGGTTISGGILSVSTDDNLGASTGALTFNGGTLEATAGFSSSRAITLNTSGGTFQADTGTLSLSGIISGLGGLTKTGAATLVLSGVNTYSGGTTISGGILSVSADDNLGTSTGALTFNGGTLEATAGFSSSRAIALNTSGGTFQADTGTLSLSGIISGLGGLTKTGAGTLVLSGVNTYSGGTTISGGILSVSADDNLGTSTGALTFNGGTLETTAGFSSSRAITLNTSGGTFQADTGTLSLSGIISGLGGLTKTGTGTLVLSGVNTYTGGTTISEGILSVSADDNLGASTGALTFNGGTLETTAGLSSSRAITLNTNGGTFLADPGTTSSFSSQITGGGSFTKDGLGTLILAGANTYTGQTDVVSGTLRAGSVTGLSLNSAFVVTTLLDLNGFNNTIGSLAGTGMVTNDGVAPATLTVGNDNTSTTFSGILENGTSVLQLTKTGTGTLILTGNNTYSGNTTISAGTLQIGNPGTTGSIAGNIIDNAALLFDRSDTFALSGSISGTGTVTQEGTGIVELTGNNTYSGATNVSAGTLQAGSPNAFSANSAFTVTSVLDLNGFSNTIGSLSGTGTVTNNDAGPAILTTGGDNAPSTFSGVLSDGSGTLGLTKTGSGTMILAGANTYTGGTTITGGTLQIGNGGTTGSIEGNITDNAALEFNRSDIVTFAGTIAGSGILAQAGSGTLILTADNTFTGTANISLDSTLQLGNGGTTGTVAGNIVDNGLLIFNRSNTLNLAAIISGTGSVQQNGSGTTILSGTNTYTGGTVVNAGTLTVNSPQALGLGRVVVNGGILNADPQPINVKGDYTQNAGGTLQLQVAGANPGQYDTLNVGGNATLGGTLQLISLGFQPKAGNELTLVTAGGAVSGRFATFLNPFTADNGIKTIDLVYGRNFVDLDFLSAPPPVTPPITPPITPLAPVVVTISFASYALTPDQLAAGNLLDEVELNPKVAGLVSFLSKEPVPNLPEDLAKISPDALTAFYEISFSNANIQRLNLEGRLDDLRSGSSGFSSNMKTNGSSLNLEGTATVDGKSSKSPVEQALQPRAENRWGVWVTGFGDFVNVDSDDNANGYDFTTGGFSLGIDYRINDQLAIGVMGEYAHTWTSLKPSGDIDVDSGRGGVYADWFNRGLYLNGGIYGGHNVYESSRPTIGGLASGGTGGAEFSTFISSGYDMHLGHLSAGPIASLQYTYVNINVFTEKGSLAPLEIHSQSAESLRTDFGFRTSYAWQIGPVLVEPSLRAAWEHEFRYSALPITASFAGIPGPSGTFVGPSEGHDSAIVSAGVTVYWTHAISTYFDYDGQLGRGNYDSNAVTGGVRFNF